MSRLERAKVWLRGVKSNPKRRRRVLTLLAVLLLAYPVLGTLALWSGFVEWAIRDEDVKVEISNPAWTVIPGRIHLRFVKIYVNGDTQFILEGHDLFASISVSELFKRRMHVTRLTSHHVRYQMRTQVNDPKGSAKRIAAYPKLEGLPGENTVRKAIAAKTEEREPDWTVKVDGLKVDVVELWFFEYRYLGGSVARCSQAPRPKLGAQAVREDGVAQLTAGRISQAARADVSRKALSGSRLPLPETGTSPACLRLPAAAARRRHRASSLSST